MKVANRVELKIQDFQLLHVGESVVLNVAYVIVRKIKIRSRCKALEVKPRNFSKCVPVKNKKIVIEFANKRSRISSN